MAANGLSSISMQNFDAVQAYSNAQKLREMNEPSETDNVSGNASASQGGDAVSSFGHVLNQAIGDAIQTGKVAETQTANALSGKGNLSDVVASVEEAKLTLQTVTTLRDKFVNAYQEVMRMSI